MLLVLLQLATDVRTIHIKISFRPRLLFVVFCILRLDDNNYCLSFLQFFFDDFSFYFVSCLVLSVIFVFYNTMEFSTIMEF